MASYISHVFPEVAAKELVNAVSGKSSIVKLSGGKMIPFNGQREFVFTLDHEASIVAENGPKVNGGGAVTAKTIIPVKFEYGLRVSDEFIYGSEEVRLQYLEQFNEGFSKKIARGIDIAAMHGFNPYAGTASAVVGNNHLDYVISNTVTATTNPDTDIESAVAMVEADGYQTNGIIVAPAERAALAALTVNGIKQFPELAWGRQPETVGGVGFESNDTVSFNSNGALAYVGQWDMLKVGIGKDITFDVIEYGCPDNDTTLGDLKGHNQVYLRAEAYIGWAILDGDAFAKIA